MYCPHCRLQYPEGTSECPDCRVPLVAAPGEAAHGTDFNPNLELVVVLETSDRIHLAMAKGLLEDAGIPFFVIGQIATLVQDVDGFLRKWVRLQVPRDREVEARQLLEQVLQPVPDEAAGE
jgi:hypothetical protein